MPFLLAFPILLITLMVQLAIASNLPLLRGTADLMIVVIIAWALQERVSSGWFWGLVGGGFVSLITAMPFFVPLVSYLLIVILVRILRRRVWQIPILVMFLSVILGTMIHHVLGILALLLNGTILPLHESFSFVTLPSILLNLILALPVYAMMTDLAKWVYPIEVEV